MRVLVATSEGQGTRPGDYCWTVEGEIVLTSGVLDCSKPDRCGCGRGFPGLASSRATTTAMVVDRAGITADDVRRAIRDSLERQGWLAELGPDEVAAWVDEEARLISWTAAQFPLGAVVSRRGDELWQRLDVAA
jgi:hypothetical protein